MSRGHAEERLILASAGIAARRSALTGTPQSGELAATLDWELLTGKLRARRLLATLGPRIIEMLGADRIDERFSLALEQALTSGRHQGAFLQMIAARAAAELEAAGIPSVPLKGPRLSEALYGDPARRPSSDIDLLVAPENLLRAVDVVRGMGYQEPVDVVDERGLPLLHFALAHERDELPPIELHWRIHWYEERFACERLLPTLAGAPSRCAAGALQSHEDPTLSVGGIDELLALLLFYARDGFVDLRLATDIGAWWDAFGPDVQAEAFERAVLAYPQLARAAVAAAQAAHDVVGLPLERLGGNVRLDWRARIAVRLANPNPSSSQAQVYADMGLIDGLLIPPKGFRSFLRRQVVPARARIREGAHDSTWLERSSVMHCLRVVSRYGLALMRLLLAPKPAESR